MYTYGAYAPKASTFSMVNVWAIIALIIAIVGGIVTYLLFLSPKNEGKYNGFVKWLYNFLSFKNLTVELILKVTYLIFAIYITLYSFAFIGSSALGFFSTLILGNLVLRIVYEGALLLILIYKNIKEINDKTK